MRRKTFELLRFFSFQVINYMMNNILTSNSNNNDNNKIDKSMRNEN